MNVDDGSNAAIDAYLDQLLVSLPGSPRQVRHTVAEIEAHLYDAARRARHDGLDDAAAGTAAVASILLLRGSDAVLIQRGNGAGQQFALAFTAALATIYLAFRARRARAEPLIPKTG